MDETERVDAVGEADGSGGGDREFAALLNYLKGDRGFDFTGYKPNSLIRRVRHRMAAIDSPSFEAYTDHLQTHPEEFAALFDTILINVTSFFRDTEAWDHLRQQVIPELLRNAGDGPIRVWSAGCASGEEAYSVAIALAEAMGVATFVRRVKVYATDVDEGALQVARQATYTERELAGVTPQQRAEFFEPEGPRWSLRKDLRRCVIFGRNDLVQDAPISKVDLLLCRNTLMYFNAHTQDRILRRFRFALKPRGVLFLGRAEMLLSHGGLFTPIDLTHRTFTKAGDSGATGSGSLSGFDLEHALSSPAETLAEQAFGAEAIAAVVVDARGRLALASVAAEGMFSLAGFDRGRPFHELPLSFRPVELRPLIDEAVSDGRASTVTSVRWLRAEGEQVVLDVDVQPVLGDDGRPVGAVVTFRDVTEASRLQNEVEDANRRLEAAYEELQSTNEELETLNEELHSINDEAQFTNEELQRHTGEVDRLNRLMESILGSLRAGVVVVDRNMSVIVWNERAEDLWGLRQDEVLGTALADLDIGVPLADVGPAVSQVLAGVPGSAVETVGLSGVDRRGRKVTVRVSFAPLGHRDGGVAGAILVIDQPTAD